MKKLYCFDFDGTITYSDTMFLFLRHYNASKFYFQFTKHIPLFILLRLGLMDAERVKKSFISSILKGETKSRIGKQAQKFFDENYPKIIRKNALDFIRNRDLEKTESLLITASLDIWTKPFAEKFGMKLLATRAEFKNEVFTGNFIGPNCNGVEKLNRIKEEVQGRKYDKTIAFGDTAGDRPMLNWAHEGHFRFFH